MHNRICRLFGIQYPIIQGGMIWCSGWRLASAVSNAGGLGLIGAGSMYPDVLQQHIRKAKAATNKPFGVNLPLLYPDIEELIQIIIDEGVKIVFTSAGNPKTWTKHLQEHGIKVAHVIASAKFAAKCDAAGVDAIVAEGFEAGGHNGREETTTLSLIPLVRRVSILPLIAAGGVSSGRSMLATMVLGADAVQLGSRFVASQESSAHANFKQAVLETKEGETRLSLKQLTPVRLIRNEFCNRLEQSELSGISRADLEQLLGKGRAKKGMFEGDVQEGELEIGQASALIDELKSARAIVDDIMLEYKVAKEQIKHVRFDF